MPPVARAAQREFALEDWLVRRNGLTRSIFNVEIEAGAIPRQRKEAQLCIRVARFQWQEYRRVCARLKNGTES